MSSSEECDSDQFDHSNKSLSRNSNSTTESDFSNIGLYSNEPEYGEEEIKRRKTENSNNYTATSSDDEFESSRLENLHWCSCGNCIIGYTMTLNECKCCRC